MSLRTYESSFRGYIMRKEFKDLFEEFLVKVNKDIVDLDCRYLLENYPGIDVATIKKEVLSTLLKGTMYITG